MADSYINYSPSYFGAIQEPPKDVQGSYIKDIKKGEIYFPISNSFLSDLSLFNAPLIPLGLNVLTREEFMKNWNVEFRQLKKVDNINYNISSYINMSKPVADKSITYDTTLGTFESSPPTIQIKKFGKRSKLVGDVNKPDLTDLEFKLKEDEVKDQLAKQDDIDDAAIQTYLQDNYNETLRTLKTEITKYEDAQDYFDAVASRIRIIRGTVTDPLSQIQLDLDAYASIIVQDLILSVQEFLDQPRRDLLFNLLFTNPSTWPEHEERSFHIKIHQYLLAKNPLHDIYRFLSTTKTPKDADDEEEEENL